MASITWSNSSPADDVTFTSMASRIQSIWTSIATGLNQSLYWQDGSDNSDGLFKAETFKTALAPELWARRTENDDGYLIQEKMPGNVAAGDAQEGYRGGGFYHVGSSDTFCVGSPFMQEHALDPVAAAPITARWVIRSGTLEGISLTSVQEEVTRSVITFAEEGDISHASQIRLFVQIVEDPDAFGLQAGDDMFIGVQKISKQTAESVISYAANAGAYPDVTGMTVNIAWLSEATETY